MLRKLNPTFHCDSCFCEQIGLSYPALQDEHQISLIRTFVRVGDPGSVSFDANGAAAWEFLDNAIENGACGIFHTHPPGVVGFSDQDFRAQHGIAKATGKKMLWHGVQEYGSKNRSVFVCANMVGGKVFRFEYGQISDNLDNPIISLPLPPVIKDNEKFFSINM